MEPGALEERRVQRVVGVVVAEHHVADVGGVDAESPQRVEDLAAVRHHAGIDDDRASLVADQHHRAGHALVGIASGQDVQLGSHAAIVAPPAREVSRHRQRGGPTVVHPVQWGVGAGLVLVLLGLALDLSPFVVVAAGPTGDAATK